MKTARFTYLFLLAFAIMQSSQGQDIHFSQFFETPLLRNPALAGLFSGDIRVQAVYRNQWNSVTTPYQTASLSSEFKTGIGFKDDYVTMGGEVFYDKAGSTALSTTSILPALNYHKSLSDEKNKYLSFGGMAGIVQRRIDRSKITTNSQFDGTTYNSTLADGENFTKTSYSYFDGSVGMSYISQIGESTNDNMFFGVAYHHFMKPKKLSFFDNPEVSMLPKLVYSAGMRFSMSDISYFTLQGDYSSQGTNKEIIGGVLYAWKLDAEENNKYTFNIGGLLRWGDAFIPVAKLEFLPLAVSVSYDMNISALKTASSGRGGFEFSLIYQKFRSSEGGSLNAVRCPKF